jgi:hypothetical protein
VRRLLILIAVVPAIVVAAVGVPGSNAGAAAPAATGHSFGARDQAPRISISRDDVPSDFSGGPVTATDGEAVTVYVQDSILSADPSAGQRWADFLAGLLHGPELARVTLLVATLDRVQQVCGVGALGCYNERSGTIVAINQDARGISATAVVSHEYGHHVANSRDNSPWPAVDWGTKRWASYLGVCAKAQKGELAPGDEGDRYELNPGEAFAEDYRVLNERRAGLPETPWRVVAPGLYPDQPALDALALDIATPWPGNTTASYKSSFGPRAIARGFRFVTPYDGNFTATLTGPPTARLSMRLVDVATGAVIPARAASARVQTANASICGQRLIQVQVKRLAGFGPSTLTVSKP